jgi:hypothetical protein
MAVNRTADMSTFTCKRSGPAFSRVDLKGLLACSSLVVLFASLGACGGGAAGPAPNVSGDSASSTHSGQNSGAIAAPIESPALPSDQEIADRLYQGRDRTPADFYQESVLPSPTSYSTTHIRNTMVASARSAAPGAEVYELCTDDWNEALAWSEEAARNMPVYADLTETNTNERFFEFVRARPQANWPPERQRVFRCSYLDRSTADLRTFEGPGGALHRTSPTAADVKELAEYLWQFTLYNNFGNAVLASSGRAANGAVEHALTIATLVRSATPGTCDRIELVRWIHSVDAGTGVITRHLEPVRHIYARESGGLATLCSAQ